MHVELLTCLHVCSCTCLHVWLCHSLSVCLQLLSYVNKSAHNELARVCIVCMSYCKHVDLCVCVCVCTYTQVDVFAVAQYERPCPELKHHPDKALTGVIAAPTCQGVLLAAQPWAQPVTLSRAWCLYEVNLARWAQHTHTHTLASTTSVLPALCSVCLHALHICASCFYCVPMSSKDSLSIAGQHGSVSECICVICTSRSRLSKCICSDSAK